MMFLRSAILVCICGGSFAALAQTAPTPDSNRAEIDRLWEVVNRLTNHPLGRPPFVLTVIPEQDEKCIGVTGGPITCPLKVNDWTPDREPRTQGACNYGTLDGETYTPPVDFVGEATCEVLVTDPLSVGMFGRLIVTVEEQPPAAETALARWGFDEGQGATATDSAGDLICTIASPAWGLDEDGSGALDVRGQDSAAQCGTLDLPPKWSATVRFFARSYPGGDPRLLSIATGTRAKDHLFMISAFRKGRVLILRTRVRIGGATTTFFAKSGTLQAGRWHTATVEHDGARLCHYLDGDEVGCDPLAGRIDVGHGIKLALGGQPTGAGARGFDGLIGSVLIEPYQAAP